MSLLGGSLRLGLEVGRETNFIAANVAKLPVTTLTLFRARINSRQNHDLP
jgi:hypothetical protein